ncbi:MAG: hypothetical protein ACRDS9_25765 [Pseudonocardiaceae bacterium]
MPSPGPPAGQQPLPCLRTERNFPNHLADATEYTDVTCSSAEIDHLWESQHDAPPQLDALTADTTVVTLGPIGANDAGIVTSVLGCLVLGRATRDGNSVHDAIETTRPELRAALRAIKRRAPRAEVVVVGHGEYLPEGGCPLVQPLTRVGHDQTSMASIRAVASAADSSMRAWSARQIRRPDSATIRSTFGVIW